MTFQASLETALLRSAHSGDADVIATVLFESRRAFLPFLPSLYSEHEVRHWVLHVLLASGKVTVAEVHGRVVGVLAVSEDSHAAWIDQLYLLPGFDGQGIGGQLLSYAHETLPRPIRLYTFQQNHGARNFYERHGYKPIEFTDGHGNEERCPDILYELGANLDIYAQQGAATDT